MHIHFIAIGGSIMHNLAIALHNKGHQVTGSDDEIFEPANSRLKQHGLLPEKDCWHPEHLTEQVDAVILGMHAKEGNPELEKARELGLPLYSFPEFIYQEIKDKKRVVIAGSHGKTTITAMVMHVLGKLGMKFDYMVGAQLEGFENSVHLSQDAETAILEGDEYLSSPLDDRPKFLHYDPQVVLLSGIAWDHMNVFPTFEQYLQAFRDLLSVLKPGSQVVYYQYDPQLVKLLGEFDHIDKIPYSAPEYTTEDGKLVLETTTGKHQLKVVGLHNLLNLEGARKICRTLGITDADFYEQIRDFSGAGKRLEKLVEKGGTLVYRDFAHAPSKVKATIEGLKKQFPDKTLIACMELHTYSSLNQEFLPQYRGSLDQADYSLVYINPEAVSRKNLPPIDSQQIKAAFGNEALEVVNGASEIPHFLQKQNLENALLIFMSSAHFGELDLKEVAMEAI